jgi:hypothetical protein
MRVPYLLAASALAACGDNLPPPSDAGVDPCGPASTADILDQLTAIPGVTATEQASAAAPAGYRYFTLQVTQPTDHTAPGGATFPQEVSLLHRDLAAPTIAFTTGYDDYEPGYLWEAAALVAGNQLSIEHRFFGTSRPVNPDWRDLTIAQMAADEHAIISALRCVYRAPWVSSGGSKGGMTAIFHHRFYPDDVAGTLAYVAPISHAIPDHRYDAFLDGVQPTACREAVRAVATELLTHRRAAMLARAQLDATQAGLSYTRIPLPAALESAILDLEWTFWQYRGASRCASVPAPTATDDQLWSFLATVSDVRFSADPTTAEFDAYFYQAYAELGSPGTVAVRGDSLPSYLAGLPQFTDADFVGSFPIGVPPPPFDPAPMADIDAWLQRDGAHLAFVYGGQDPWTAGQFTLGNATDALMVYTPRGTHDDGVAALTPADRAAVLAKLSAWTGVDASARTLRGYRPAPPQPGRRGHRAAR